MRNKVRQGDMSVYAVAGTHVVMLGIDLDPASCDGLLGFAIERTAPNGETRWLQGLKTFQATDPGGPPGQTYSTRQHPIQGFTWSDLSAMPGLHYKYRVVALKGSPQQLTEAAEVTVNIETEAPVVGSHQVHFNRGSAASQEYRKRFGTEEPDNYGPAAFEWLSRGLVEALVGFIDAAHNNTFALRVCAYEFHAEPVLSALKRAVDRGVDVRIIYDHRNERLAETNDKAVQAAGLLPHCIQRQANASYISHNKFIVRIEGNQPKAVLTGSTNFSKGGIYGHSNVVHIVEEALVAVRYLAYWQLLSTDPLNKTLQPQVTALLDPLPEPVQKGTTAVFSPRKGLDALSWYASMAMEATEAVFGTFAFGMHDLFKEVYRSAPSGLRYALLETEAADALKPDKKMAERKAIAALRQMPENRFAIGAHLTRSHFDRWLAETLTGLNHNVQYLHTKYLLLDPLSNDPLVISGSANFSENSCNRNDENMLVIRGNTRVADIYLGEFMRLYKHYAWREFLSRPTQNKDLKHLELGDWWRKYFGDTEQSRQRAYFAGTNEF